MNYKTKKKLLEIVWLMICDQNIENVDMMSLYMLTKFHANWSAALWKNRKFSMFHATTPNEHRAHKI